MSMTVFINRACVALLVCLESNVQATVLASVLKIFTLLKIVTHMCLLEKTFILESRGLP